MRRPRPSSDRGFTLLECEVALIVLTLAVLLLSRLIVSHDRIVQDMEGWLDGDPVYWVAPRANEWERILGHAAELTTTQPGPESTGGRIVVLEVTRTLDPPTVVAIVDGCDV